MFNFIKQKKIYCGKNHLEVDIYPRTRQQVEVPKGKRAKKKKVTRPAQRNLNAKRAKRYFVQLVNTNFGARDIHLTLTYKSKFHPKTLEEAEKNVQNFIKRVNYRRKKLSLKNAKYVSVIEYQLEGEVPIKIHHHIIIDGELDRDELENIWRHRKKKGQKVGEKIGRSNTSRLQPDREGLAALANYLCKYEYRKRRWSSSTNLEKPDQKISDYKWSKRTIEKIAKMPFDRALWERHFKGWEVTSEMYGYQAVYNEFTGWSIYLKMVRKKGVEDD